MNHILLSNLKNSRKNFLYYSWKLVRTIPTLMFLKLLVQHRKKALSTPLVVTDIDSFFQQIAKKDIIPIDLNNNPVKHYSWLFFNVTVLDRPLGEGNNIRKEAQNNAPALKIFFQKFFTM